MSIESAKELLVELREDEDFRRRVLDFEEEEAAADYLKQQGHGFTKEEVTSARAEMAGELSDEDPKDIAAAGCGCGCGGSGGKKKSCSCKIWGWL